MIATQTSTPEATARESLDDRVLVDLTRLLLSDERRAIAAIRADVSKLDEKVGSDDGLTRAIAGQLVSALKVAERENHRALAGVMAPVVVSGIRSEILNSREMMVEALYPITGRLVKTAVRNAIKQLSEDINRKLEDTLSLRPVRLRFKAVITRRPLSDILLTEAMRGRLERLILIERASGAVLAATNAQGLPEPETNGALDLWGGLVSAIVQFAGHALADTQDELRQLDFGGQIILLRASPLFILAAITTAGSRDARLPAAVDEGFLGFLDHLREGKAASETTALADLHQRVAERLTLAPTTRLWTLKIVAFGLAVLLALGSWHLVTRQRQDATVREQAVQATQAAFVAQTARLAALEKTLSATQAEADQALASTKDATVREEAMQAAQAAFVAQTARLATMEKTLSATQAEAEQALASAKDATVSEQAMQAAQAAFVAQTARLAALEKTLSATQAEAEQALASAKDATVSEQAMQATQAAFVAQTARLGALEKTLSTTQAEAEQALASAKDAAASAQAAQAVRAAFVAQTARLAALEKTLSTTQAEADQALASTKDATVREQAMQAARAAFVAQTARLAEMEKTLSATQAETEQASASAKDATARAQALQDDTHAKLGEQAARTAALEQALVTTTSATRAREIENAQRITDQLAARLDTPQSRVEKAVRETAIFFGDGAAYRDPAQAAADLGRLANALADAPAARLHVVGYGDGSGTVKANLDVAHDRAARVVSDLAALGVDPKRLRMATKRPSSPIVDEPVNSGRRVVFELAFTSE